MAVALYAQNRGLRNFMVLAQVVQVRALELLGREAGAASWHGGCSTIRLRRWTDNSSRTSSTRRLPRPRAPRKPTRRQRLRSAACGSILDCRCRARRWALAPRAAAAEQRARPLQRRDVWGTGGVHRPAVGAAVRRVSWGRTCSMCARRPSQRPSRRPRCGADHQSGAHRRRPRRVRGARAIGRRLGWRHRAARGRLDG